MNIIDIKTWLLVNYPIIEIIVKNTNFIANLSVSTVENDGENIYYNQNYIETISDEQKKYLFACEIWYIAFNYANISKNKDLYIWKKSAYMLISYLLKRDGLSIFDEEVNLSNIRIFDVESIYSELLIEMKRSNSEQKNIKIADSNIKRKIRDYGFNSCDIKEDQSTDKKREFIRKLSEIGELEIFEKNRAIRRKRLESLNNEFVKKGSISEIKHSSNNDIRSIETSNLFINWRHILKPGSKINIDWSYQNAEIVDGVVTPQLYDIFGFDTEILLDISHYITEEIFNAFLMECEKIMQISKIKIGFFDCKFYGFEEIRSSADLQTIKDHFVDIKFDYIGQGIRVFANYECAVRSFSQMSSNRIIFTDGYSKYFPCTDVDATWVIFGRKNNNPYNGQVIYIEDKDDTLGLDRIYQKIQKEKREHIVRVSSLLNSFGSVHESKNSSSEEVELVVPETLTNCPNNIFLKSSIRLRNLLNKTRKRVFALSKNETLLSKKKHRIK